MPSSYSGSATYHTSITIPSDGDARTAASVNTALQALQDNTKYLKGTSLLMGAGNLRGKSGLHTWASGTAYALASNAGICSSGASDTPFTSGLASGDILVINYTLGLVLQQANAFAFKVQVSESAADFVTGTWADVDSSHVSFSLYGPTVTVASATCWPTNFSFVYVVGTGSGQVRFGISGNDIAIAGGTCDDSGGSHGSYLWFRPA